ncbi:MAG: cytochrome c oxidase assembly protein [Candidatus Dormibacteria bacterium]
MRLTALIDLGPGLGLMALVAALAWTILWLRGGGPAEREGHWKRWSLLAGLLLLGVAFFSPLADLASHQLLTAHLIQVTLVMGFVPPLLLLSLPASITRSVPPWISRPGRVVTQPVVATLLVNLVFFAWHSSAPYNAALADARLYALQQASLLLVSLAFWWPIVGPRTSSRPGMAPFAKLGYILLATIPHTFAGMTVALAKHPLYAAYERAPRAFGLGVMADQQMAGACMALVSKLALFTAFSVVFARMLTERSADDDDDDRGERGPQPQGPTPTLGTTPMPGWLGRVESGDTVSEPEPAPQRTPVPVG